jgi:hypothetical protein
MKVEETEILSIMNKKKWDDNHLAQTMTELMTAVIFKGLVCDWFNQKTSRMGGFLFSGVCVINRK